ncbi:MAG: hypothetical protein AB7S69_12715 [Salinivirgaceae bacterium]
MFFSTIIITSNHNNFFEIEIAKKGIKVFDLYRGNSFFLRNLRGFWFKCGFPFSHIWFNKYILKLNVENIIIFDSLVIDKYLDWLYKKKHSSRIILWYWNPFKKSLNHSVGDTINIERWSYSKNDSLKFDLKYNTQFYFKSIHLPMLEIEYDVFFVGRDKGRLSELLKLENYLNELGIKTNFHITPDRKKNRYKNKYYKKVISYKKVLSLIAQSKVILDYLANPYEDITLRVMESIFLKKKIITNSQIIELYDFYCKENIFVLGKDNIQDLPNFINSEYMKVDNNIIENYEFSNWLNRFNL